MPSLTIDSPVGPLTLVEEDGALVALEFGGCSDGPQTDLLRRAKAELADYFAGRRKSFDLPLNPRGTPFQRALWRLLQRIPYGEVRTYGELAVKLKSVPRAVGGACGRNPLPILIPCHRVVADRSVGGYSGGEGVSTKQRLLALERLDLFAAQS